MSQHAMAVHSNGLTPGGADSYEWCMLWRCLTAALAACLCRSAVTGRHFLCAGGVQVQEQAPERLRVR